MGYENLYGEGKGQAKVWGRNVGLDMLAQAYEQDRRKREKEDADIQAEVAKINYDGVRQADIPYFTKSYANIKAIERQLLATTKPEERAQIRADLGMAKQKMFTDTAMSKQEGQTWGELGKLKFTKPDELSDTFTPDYVLGNNLSTFDPAYKPHVEKLTSTMFAPNFDVNKETKAILEQAVVPIKEQIRQGRAGSLSYVEKVSGTELDPALVKAKVHAKAAGSNVFRRQLRQMFPTLNDTEREDAFSEQIYKENEKAYRVTKSSNIGSQYDIRPSWSDLHPKSPSGDSPESKELYTQRLLTGIINGDKGFVEILKPYLPPGAVIERVISKTTKNSKGGYKALRVRIPALREIKNGVATTVMGAVDMDIPLDRGNPFNELNAVVSRYGTGLKTVMPKLMTVEGKGKGDVYNPVINNPQRSAPKNNSTNNATSTTNSVSSTYANTQKLKDAKGNIIEAGVKNGKWYNTKTGKPIE